MPLDRLVFLTPLGIELLDPLSQEISNPETRHVLAPQDISAIPSPKGKMLAYIVGQGGFEKLSIIILAWPDGQVYEQSLYPESFNPSPELQPGDPGVNAIRGMLEVTSFDWSPDGGSIVFTAMTEDLKAGPFLWNVQDLTAFPLVQPSHPDHVLHPQWSPDGQNIIYVTASAFGEGDGYQLTGVWSVGVDGLGPQLLYAPPGSRDEIIAGWISPEEFLVYSRQPECGFSDLRIFNLRTGNSQLLWKTSFNGIAYDSLMPGVLISVDRFTANCGGGTAGLFHFFIPPGQETIEPAVLTQEEGFLPTFDPASGLFLARTPDNVLAFQPVLGAFVLDAPEPFLPAVGPAGRLAWASPISGVWIGSPGETTRRISGSPAGLPAWTPVGTALYFLDAEGLWVATVPDFTPELIEPGFSASSAFWLRSP